MSDIPRIDARHLPRSEADPLAVRIDPPAERAIRDGHPWLFGDSVASVSREAPAGTVAVLFDRKNRFLAAGLYDPEGPIRVRILVRGSSRKIGPELFRERLQDALALRSDVASGDTTGFRVLHGENDRMPGLVADLYRRTVVLKLYTGAWLPRLPELLPSFQELLAPERILLLSARRVRSGGSVSGDQGSDDHPGEGILLGPPLDEGVAFLETGLRFEAHPFRGHKTGFYLDQRENRRKLEQEVSRGDRVLNVFSYSGAFSVYAARGGAAEVVSVDQAAPALDQAQRHFALNEDDAGVADCDHRTLQGDAFEVMESLTGRGEIFDVVVIDPPSFATAAAHRKRALSAYGRLTGLAMKLLRRGGLLAQFSCSSRVEADAFFSRVRSSARTADRPLEELDRTGHPADHPVGFPEGAYLKGLWGRS